PSTQRDFTRMNSTGISKTAKDIAVLLASIALLGFIAPGCTTAPFSTGSQWRPIFDGHSKAGWEMAGPGELKLESGELVTYGGMGLLWYARETFGNCQIRVVFKLSKPQDNRGGLTGLPHRPPPARLWVHWG